MSGPERVAIVGTRDFQDLTQVIAYVQDLPPGTVVISGGGGAVDYMAVKAAGWRGLPRVVFKADWEKHGKAAGPMRNSQIVSECDRLVAFWDGQSRGTADAVKKARAAGKPVEVRTARPGCV